MAKHHTAYALGSTGHRTLREVAAHPRTTPLSSDHAAMAPLMADGYVTANATLDVVRAAAGLVRGGYRGPVVITYTISPEGRDLLDRTDPRP